MGQTAVTATWLILMWTGARLHRYANSYVQAHPDAKVGRLASPFLPAPGQYIVSASYLDGVGIRNPDSYAWFRHLAPTTILAHSFLVFDVPHQQVNWIAQCDQPWAPLVHDEIAAGTGRPDLRETNFDCTNAWLYPGGAAGGLYALQATHFARQGLCLPLLLPCQPVAQDSFVARHLAETRLSYEQAAFDSLPAFSLYQAPAREVALPPSLPVRLAAGGLPLAAAAGSASLPVSFDGPLALLSVRTYESEGRLEVETWWRVVDGPVENPFSIMAHLVSADGKTVDVSDGLGTSPLALLPGDVIVQRHRFKTSGSGNALVIGAYWLDSMQRWNVEGNLTVDTVLVPLNAAQ